MEHVEDALWEARVDHDAVAKVALSALGVAADRPWWVALRIISAARQSWDVLHVNQAVGVSLAGWLDELWSKIMAHIDPKHKTGWVIDVEKIPKGWETDKPLDFTEEEQAFLAAMKQVAR